MKRGVLGEASSIWVLHGLAIFAAHFNLDYSPLSWLSWPVKIRTLEIHRPICVDGFGPLTFRRHHGTTSGRKPSTHESAVRAGAAQMLRDKYSARQAKYDPTWQNLHSLHSLPTAPSRSSTTPSLTPPTPQPSPPYPQSVYETPPSSQSAQHAPAPQKTP